MTDTKFSLDYITVNELFNNGVCLTHQAFERGSADIYALNLKAEYEKNTGTPCMVVSKTATMAPDNLPRFHFFSNGVLIHQCLGEPEKLKRIRKMIELHGYEIKEEHGPDKNNQAEFFYYSDFIDMISREAHIRYSYSEDLEVRPLPDKKTFVENCFKHSGILLTASKDENISPEYRKILALFEDGSYFINEEYKGRKSAFNQNKARIFWQSHPDYVYLRRIYVPKDYIEALYKNAEGFPWYAMDNKADKEKNEFEEYAKNLFENNTCLSVCDKSVGMYEYVSPDVDRFALFSDGKLFLSEDKYKTDVLEKYLIDNLQKIYPNTEYVIKKVPDKCISAIYEQLPSYQKSAKTIYLEILKQKARKLKKAKGIPHHEALEEVAQKCGFANWHEATQISEENARYGVGFEEKRKDF